MRAVERLLLVAVVQLERPQGVAAQCEILLNPCSKPGGSDDPRQFGWEISNSTVGDKTASQLVDSSLVGVCKVGPALNCPGPNSHCHSWGKGFGDRNGVMSLVGSSDSFEVQSWPDTKSLPVEPNQTPPGQCLTATTDGHVVMLPIGPKCISLSLQGNGKNAKVVVAGPAAVKGKCLDTAPPPAPTPPGPPPAPPAYAGVTCKDPKFMHAKYCDKDLPVPERVAAIVSNMTIWEKIEMTDNGNTGIGRLGIRPFQFGEGLHGVMANCGAIVGEPDQFGPRTGCPTSYPSGIAEGATFNKSLWLAVGAADGREGRALHNQPQPGKNVSGALSGNGLAAISFWAPDMNLFRDPRWGRGQEVPGEDPVLTSEYVKHFSQGLMHGDTNNVDVDTEHLQIISTCKHFAGYDIETGRSGNNVNISARMLTEYYLPVFKTCVQVAKVKSIMCSYNAVNGVPSCANGKFQNDIVRAEWGWDGFIVSDCGAIGDVQNPHKYTSSPEDTVAATLKGGCDLECDSYYKEYLYSALNASKIAEADIDTAVSRTLTHFIALGELDGPDEVIYQTYGPEMVDTTEHRLLSLSVAEQAMTLLKNQDSLLPLKKSDKVAFIGPQANFTQQMLSNYEGQNVLVNNHSTIMAAQRMGISFTYSPGHSSDVSSTDKSMIPAAVAAAKAADVAVVMVGLCADHCAGKGRTENEGNDRGPGGSGWHTLGLPGAQEDLLEAVFAANKKTVLVMINGGMLSISWAKEHIPAILEAYYPGQLGGDAIVNTLFGDNNPGGKTPVTWYPESITERSMYDMDISSGDGLTHLYYSKGDELWPFGFGLSCALSSSRFFIRVDIFRPSAIAQFRSYICTELLVFATDTTFSYTWSASTASRIQAALPLSTVEIAASGGGIGYECTVKNTGSVVGDAVVLGFANSTDPQFPREKLFDFERVSLQPGESQTVLLTVTSEDLSIVEEDGRRWLRSGEFTVAVGDRATPATHGFTVVGEYQLLDDTSRLY